MLIEEAIAELIEEMGPKTPVRDACAYALEGGKRVRPKLTLAVAKSLGTNDVMPAALCVELMHTASLIADDLPCMDDDDFRRGKLAVHKAFDEATAILSIFALIAAGYRLLEKNARLINRPDLGLLAIENVSQNGGLQGLVTGQYYDLNPPAQDANTFLKIFQAKTGALFESALVLGWLFGEGDLARLPKVKEAAHHYGLAFQLEDDLDDIGDNDPMNAFLVLDDAKERLQAAQEKSNAVLLELGVCV